MELYHTLTTQIAKMSRSIKRIKSEEMADLDPGLKGPHVSCLYYIYKSDGTMTAKEISDVCEEDKAAISRSLDYLEREGYISSESKTEKRYKCPLSLTTKGQEVGVKIAEKIDKIVVMAGTGLSDENRKIFYETLSLINNNLKKLYDTYGEKENG